MVGYSMQYTLYTLHILYAAVIADLYSLYKTFYVSERHWLNKSVRLFVSINNGMNVFGKIMCDCSEKKTENRIKYEF